MLVDVKFKTPDPLFSMIAETISGTREKVHVQKGVYISGHWNFDSEVDGKVESYPEFSPETAKMLYDLHTRFPEKYEAYTGPSPEVLASLHKIDSSVIDEYGDTIRMGTYGVVDSIEQLLSLYDFEADPRNLVISMVSIKRENQPDWGGWRWHKWGTYYGTQKPEHEYLYNDTHIDEVFTFHVYEIL